MRNMRLSRSGLAAIYILLGLGLAIAFYPFFYMVSNSLKTGMEIMAYPNALPKHLTVEGYLSVFRQYNMPLLFRNSAFLAVMGAFLGCLLNAMMAYALEKMRFRGRDLLFKVILSTMMIPGILLLVPTYMFMYRIHWIDTYRVLLLPGAVSAYNIFLIKQFFKHIDNEYIEAAQCDGASHGTIFLRIVIPMSVPIITTVGLLSFMGSWNDLFTPRPGQVHAAAGALPGAQLHPRLPPGGAVGGAQHLHAPHGDRVPPLPARVRALLCRRVPEVRRKSVKRTWLAVIAVVGVLAVTYVYTWASAYARSQAFMLAVQSDLARGDVSLALKGGKVLDARSNGYVTHGGLQTVIETWESPWALPKPGLYGQAVAELDAVIGGKLDAATGMAIIQQYARLDRKLLDRIALRTASLYAEQGRTEEARRLYQESRELFPQDAAFQARVDEGLKSRDAAK
jgi:multiple sugar transport system permease protein